MTSDQKKAVLFTPFWRQENHVGCYRVDRFLRWLTEEGYKVVIIRAGRLDGHRKEPWGEEITVKDPLGFFPEPTPGSTHVSVRKPNNWRRSVALWVFNPDPTIIWARRAAGNPRVLDAARGAAFILSSSPPDSVHVGAWLISRRLGIPHLVDMRDGWLDEPLRSLLRTSAVRRWRERRLEAPILRNAKGIQVTSDVWKALLCDRYPSLAPKVQVLTNGYPRQSDNVPPHPTLGGNEELILIHAGGFLVSRPTQSPHLLLEPLIQDLSRHRSSGTIQLIGPLSKAEMAIIEPYKQRFSAIRWEVDCVGRLPRSEVLERLPKAGGLLLLAATHAAIPSKLFEYIPTGKPLYVVTHRNSAVWNLCSSLPQAVLVGSASGNVASATASRQEPWYRNRDYTIPPQFSEDFLGRIFKKTALGK
jgi:hypothetical protein